MNVFNSPDSAQKFAIEFMEAYLQNGFGRMSKTEIDILIFHLLSDEVFSSFSNYELSRVLKISGTKVANLKYEASLRYSKYDDDTLKDEFAKIVDRSKFKVDKDKITFCIENKLVRSYIDDQLKLAGSFSDTSFNRELVTIHSDMLLELLKQLYGEDKVIKLENLLKPQKSGCLKKLLKNCLSGATKEVGEQCIKLIFNYFIGKIVDIAELTSLLIK